jgi:Ca2+-binding EF-hand superfamily protein
MGDQQLKAWFDAIDVDHSGRLDSKELQRALAMGNLRYGVNDVVSTQIIVDHHVHDFVQLQQLTLAAKLSAACMHYSCCSCCW